MTETDCGVFTSPAAVFVAESVFVATIPLTGAVGSSLLLAVTTRVSSASACPASVATARPVTQSLVILLYLNILFAMSLVEIAIIIPFPHQKNLMA